MSERPKESRYQRWRLTTVIESERGMTRSEIAKIVAKMRKAGIGRSTVRVVTIG